MNTSILFHKIIDEKLFSKLGVTSQPYSATYINEELVEIVMGIELIEGQNKVYQVKDPKVHWDPSIHNLSLNKKVMIMNPGFLFGKDGIVSKDEYLGVAIRWFSRDAKQRKVINLSQYISWDSGPLEFEINFDIEKGLLRGYVTFEIIVYKADKMNDNSINHFVRPGTILGVLESIDIMFDGDTSMFPIVEVNDPNKPLWWVDCNFTEPLYDAFSEENVSIVLNLGHKNAKKLSIDKGLGSSPLLMEIIASGLQIIIEKVKESGDWNSIIYNRNTEPGSIGEAIYYLINTFGWDISSPENLAKSIRFDFDSKFN